MRDLLIQIELNGENIYVGDIVGNDSKDACFTYAESYVNVPEHRSISISLPLMKRTFDAQATRNFFEGFIARGIYKKMCR